MEMMSRNDPFTDYPRIFRYYVEHSPRRLDDALVPFLDAVKPDIDFGGASEDSQRLQTLFAEWFMFEYRLPVGHTPIEEFAKLPRSVTGLNAAARADLKQAFATQLVSMFWITGASASKHELYLEDANTGKRYDVFDMSVSAALDGTDHGMLVCRLVLVRDTWLLAGTPVVEFPVKPTQRLKDITRESYNGESISFLDRIARVYGPKSEGDDGTALTNQAALGESSGQNDKPMVFGMSETDGLSGDEYSED